MSADRCPSCAAAVRPGASWCSQCYADLRPAPVAAPVVTTAAPAPPAGEDAFTAPIEDVSATLLTEVPAQPDGGASTEPLPGVVPVDPTPTTWPCLRCQTAVPFDDDECPNCHAKFLDSALPGADATLLDRLPRGQRKASTAFMVMVFGGLGLTGLFVGLFALLAAIF